MPTTPSDAHSEKRFVRGSVILLGIMGSVSAKSPLFFAPTITY